MKPQGVSPRASAAVVVSNGDAQVVELKPPGGPKANLSNLSNVSNVSSKADSMGSKKAKPEISTVSELFRYATWMDIVCMIFGSLAAGVVGAAQPAMMVLFGSLIDGIGSVLAGNPAEQIVESVNTVCLQFTVLAAILFVCAWLAEACFKSSGVRQSAAWRKAYLQAIVRQDVGWYDVNKSEELSSRVAESTQAIEEGISSKLSLGARYLFQGLVGLILAFIYKWDMALVLVRNLLSCMLRARTRPQFTNHPLSLPFPARQFSWRGASCSPRYLRTIAPAYPEMSIALQRCNTLPAPRVHAPAPR